MEPRNIGTLATGRTYSLDDLKPGDISIYDIALHSAKINRFAGGTPGESESSLLLHLLTCDRLAREAGLSAVKRLHVLLHDSAEIVTNDIPSHSKRKLPGYTELEEAIFKQIALRLFPPGKAPRKLMPKWLKVIDDQALRLERIAFNMQPGYVGTINTAPTLSKRALRAMFLNRLRQTMAEAWDVLGPAEKKVRP